jgi:outer membrane protein assembly factor BamB
MSQRSHSFIRTAAGFIALAAGASVVAVAADWPHWGRDASRNMVSAEKGLPAAAELGDAPEGDQLTPDPAKSIQWVVKLGSQTYGNPTVAGGRVFVGTNNDSPRDPKYQGDRGVLMCFDEGSGKFLWQLVVPKHPAGRNVDWEFVGLCSSPAVEGDRVYVVTNRCEVVCLDARGMANGNDGPFKEEAAYFGTKEKPVEPGATDADVIWRFDMLDGLGVYPRYQTSSAVLLVGNRLYATTSNSVDWTGKHTPAPDAPALVCLDKNTGKLLAEEKSGISRRTFTSNWSSPAYGEFNGKPLIVFGGGDGWCYGLDPDLKEVWRYDCNPKDYRAVDGKPVKYEHEKGPSEIIATPVVVDGRVYVAIGQDPEKGDGVGAVNCIDGTKTGDITASGRVWQFTGINRSMSTASVAEGLLYVGDFAGFIYCLDAAAGNLLWKHDTEGRMWGSTLLADGKVYAGNENGLLTVLAAGREAKKLGEIDFGSALYSTPVAANGAMYVATEKHLYAVRGKDAK